MEPTIYGTRIDHDNHYTNEPTAVKIPQNDNTQFCNNIR